jgi:hypothetical protein
MFKQQSGRTNRAPNRRVHPATRYRLVKSSWTFPFGDGSMGWCAGRAIHMEKFGLTHYCIDSLPAKTTSFGSPWPCLEKQRDSNDGQCCLVRCKPKPIPERSSSGSLCLYPRVKQFAPTKEKIIHAQCFFASSSSSSPFSFPLSLVTSNRRHQSGEFSKQLMRKPKVRGR